ncbi:hypothetical protein DICPUDRAFT_56948 [Dictyostelium purpureum]|uniref:Uncharacterized protein n=1 Tax=Dictyostelium purpureum TaxID=5786 RepID=F0ZTQ4_DICPU|nr:uncharacterized protein DICPUDRAFT_56948 [Dictyostelium purpureum]EGC32665.1 hypothetical protein DICPUDRAFT_56948 [Dictyostelium purpureum]|eukprot:XP_003290798.1 hypothetical protein DICPUDRAFT_56948 [Dictyostelium purpureum]
MHNNINNSLPKDIAVIGIGLRLPGNSNNPESLWNNLLESFDAITQVPKDRWASSYKDMNLINNKYGGFLQDSQWKNFDPLFFGISPAEAPFIDPQQRLLLSIVWESLEDAHIKPESLRGSNTGVFVGVSNIDYSKMVFQDNYKIAPYTITGTNTSLNSNRISYCYDFRGPSMTVDTACSSSLISVGLGVQAIQSGECDLAVCGGVNALFDPTTSIAFSKLGVLNENGRCNTFSDQANGYVRSEGAGVVLLKSLSQAEKDGDRIYGVIKGVSTNEDGSLNKNSLTTPSTESQSNNINNAMKKSTLSPNDIYYIEAHGTGTKVGDPIEVQSISNVFSKDRNQVEDIEPLFIGSFKSNIGHLESAAGIASLIKVCLMLKNRILVPSINCSKLNPAIPFDNYKIKVVREVQMFPNNKTINIGINSFGFGGSNCHLIIQEYNKPTDIKCNTLIRDSDNNNKNYLIPFSMNSKISLEKYINLIKNNNYHEYIFFKDFVKYQILSKQYTLSNRMTIIANDWQSLIKSSNETYSHQEFRNQTVAITDGSITDLVSSNEPILVYVFCGQGPQWNGMMKTLYRTEPVFKNSVDYIDQVLSKYFGYSIFQKFSSISDNDDSINHPVIAQPSLFLLQIGLVELFKYWGIFPSISIGHSFGEVSSYYLSGLISLETVCRIVYVRSFYQNQTMGTGKMLVCSISNEQWLSEYSTLFSDLEIACINSSDSIVVTGNELRLKEFANILNESQIFNTFLRSPCSFHSSKQEIIKDSIFSELVNVESKESTEIPLFSTVTGELVNEPLSATTIYENVRKPVLFKNSIESLIKFYHQQQPSQQRQLIFIEIAPHPTLGSLIKKTIQESVVPFKTQPLIIAPLNRKENQDISIKKLISQLYFNGINIDFKFQLDQDENQDSSFKETTNSLPRYQWDDSEEYWAEPSQSKKNRLEGPSSTLLGYKIIYSFPVYQTVLDLQNSNFSYLLDHIVAGKPVFPGAGYIDIINQFFVQTSDIPLSNEIISIESIQFLQPLMLNQHKLTTLQSLFEPTKKSSFSVSFFSKDEKDDQIWVNTCKAKVTLEPMELSQNRVEDLELLKSQCNITQLDKKDLYDKISKDLGLFYNDAFQIVQSIHTGVNCSFATLQMPESNVTHSSILNSCFLDNCFHGLLTLINEKGSYVVESVNSIAIFLENISVDSVNSPFYLETKIIKSSPFSTEGTCRLFNKQGKLILSIGKFTIKSTNLKPKVINQLETPLNETFSIEWQSKDSPIPPAKESPIKLDSLELFNKSTILKDQDFEIYCSCLIFNQLVQYNPLFKVLATNFIQDQQDDANEENYCLSIMKELGISIDYQRFFFRILKIVKLNFSNLLSNQKEIDQLKDSIKSKFYGNSNSEDLEFQCIEKVSNIIPKLLFENDKQSSMTLFENSLLTKFYGQSISTRFYLEYVASLVLESIKPIVREKRVFKILEIGAGTGSLSNIVLEKLNKFLSINSDKNIIVEYNFTDISSSFIIGLQETMVTKYPNISFKFSVLDLEKDIKDQDFFYSDYDIVLMAYVIHAVSNITFAVKQIYNLLSPRGWLLCIEPKANIVFSDLVFGCFGQWWNYQDSIRTSHCSLESEQWKQVLSENGFPMNSFIGSLESNSHSFIIHSQKESITQIKSSSKLSIEKISFVVNENQKLMEPLLNDANTISMNPVEIIKLNQLDVEKLSISSVVFFMVGLELMETYKEELYQFIQLLNQLSLSNFNGKVVLVTKQSFLTSRNYFSRSLVAIARSAMNEYSNLDIVSIDLDSNDYNLNSLLVPIQSRFSDNEFIYKKGILFVSRFFKNNSKLLLSSQSFETNDNNMYQTTLSDLSIIRKAKDELSNNEIEIKVKSVGINFKDNLFYKGLLPQEIFRKGDINNPPFGLECSGIISRIGNGVTEFKVGDQVFGFARHSLGSHVITNKDLVIKKPESITWDQAASIPVVYCTAYYSLFNIAHLNDNNESVLIHSATGGVGLASLNLLKMKKFENVYATVGSEEKKQYLESNYSFIKSIFSTRTKEYSGQLENKVDVILNTLSGDFIESNFKSLKSFGRLIDISVTHIYANQQIGLGNFKSDHLYTAVDLERLIDEKPLLLKSILSKVTNEIDNGNLELIKINQFNSSEVKTAVESLSNRSHIGKIVVSNCENMVSSSESRIQKKKYDLKLDSTILITGQSGLSIPLIEWLLTHSIDSVSNVVIISKSPMKWKLQNLVFKFKNVKFNYIQADISNYDEIYASLKSLPDLPPIKSVFHLAACYNDVPMNQVTMDTIESVHNPKVCGSINLHRLSISLGWNLSHFILFSSITGITGYPDQSVYNSANIILDALSNHRRVMGLPSFAINLGPMKGEGKVSDVKAIKKLFKSRGLPSLSLNKLFGLLEVVINNPLKAAIPSQFICSPIDFNNYLDTFKNMNTKLSHLSSDSISKDKEKERELLSDSVSIKDKVLEKVSELLSIPISKINMDTSLKMYGLDSLLSVQFKSWVDNQFEKGLINHLELSSITVNSFIEKVNTKFGGSSVQKQPITIVKVIETPTATQTTVPAIELPQKPVNIKTLSCPLSIKTPILLPSNELSVPLFKSTASSPELSMTTPPIVNIRNLNNSILDTPPLESRKNHVRLITSNIHAPSQLQTIHQPKQQLAFKTNNNAFILGLGNSVPGEPISQEKLKESISNDFSNDPKTNEKVKRIFEQSHIKTRYLVRDYTKEENSIKYRSKESITDVNEAFKDCVPDLAEKACTKAIADWGGNKEDITHIMSVSSTGVIIPDVNFKLIDKLQLNQDIERVSLNMMGCLAGLSSLRTASSLAKASPRNRVLVVCTEICSLHFNNTGGGDQMVASSIFADGAAAYIVGCSPKINETPFFEVIQSINRATPNTENAMVWDLQKEGWNLGLASSIPHVIGEGIEKFVNDLLYKAKSQVSSLSPKECEFLIHTGGKSILMNIENALGIDPKMNKHTWDIYHAYGNMSSASVIFVLDHARKSKNLPTYSISLAFGPGLAFEGCLLRNLV